MLRIRAQEPGTFLKSRNVLTGINASGQVYSSTMQRSIELLGTQGAPFVRAAGRLSSVKEEVAV